METERVSMKEASEILGMKDNTIRLQMDRGLLPIGIVVPSSTGKRNSYYIYRSKLNAFLGRSNEQ